MSVASPAERTAVITALLLLNSPVAAEATDGSWRPGHTTTATLPGEVQAGAAHEPEDGVYGRFDGDVDLAVNTGAELESGSARLQVAASAHYYWTAGVYASYRQALGGARDDLDVDRLGSVGIDIRPLFIPRWSFDWERGPALLDLLIDSVSVSGGAFFAKPPPDQESERRGFELGFGLGVPLLGTAAGPWLGARYTLRWPEAGDRSDSVWLTLGWHFLIVTPLSGSTGDVL